MKAGIRLRGETTRDATVWEHHLRVCFAESTEPKNAILYQRLRAPFSMTMYAPQSPWQISARTIETILGRALTATDI